MIHQSGGAQARWFHYNGVRTSQENCPAGIRHFKTYSFYLHQGTVWIYPQDATQRQVGDGSQHPSTGEGSSTQHEQGEPEGWSDREDDESDLGDTEDWAPMAFEWLPDSDDCLVRVRGEHETLRPQQSSQNWVNEVIPAAYQATNPPAAGSLSSGGMAGDLPTIIALMALSVRPSLMERAIMYCMKSQYHPHRSNEAQQGWHESLVSISIAADKTQGKFREVSLSECGTNPMKAQGNLVAINEAVKQRKGRLLSSD